MKNQLRNWSGDRICKLCKVNQDLLTGFSYIKNKDVYRLTCRECERLKAKARIRLGLRKYSKSNKTREQMHEYSRNTKERYPERYKARVIFNCAIKNGKLKRLPCEKCGDTKSQGHHKDYTKPLEVTWFCKRHHAEQHRENTNIPKDILAYVASNLRKGRLSYKAKRI